MSWGSQEHWSRINRLREHRTCMCKGTRALSTPNLPRTQARTNRRRSRQGGDFRCRWGEVYLHVPGKPTPRPKAIVPAKRKRYFTVWNEVVLKPGDQFTLLPNVLHWFQGGDKGAIVSEFSTRSRDETDVFTDPEIRRETIVSDRKTE